MIKLNNIKYNNIIILNEWQRSKYPDDLRPLNEIKNKHIPALEIRKEQIEPNKMFPNLKLFDNKSIDDNNIQAISIDSNCIQW